MLGVGQKFPPFSLKAVVASDPDIAFVTVSNETYKDKWLVVFFWPKDFTFVCPTEISAFGSAHKAFQEMGTQVLGVSTDSEYVHLAWRQNHKALQTLPFPMLADIKRELAQELEILDPSEGVAQRATYIVDSSGVIRFASVTDLSVGRNVDEVLRVLAALQNGGLCPCGWQPGQPTLAA